MGCGLLAVLSVGAPQRAQLTRLQERKNERITAFLLYRHEGGVPLPPLPEVLSCVCAATKSRESGFSQKVNPNVTFFQCRMEGGLLEKLRI